MVKFCEMIVLVAMLAVSSSPATVTGGRGCRGQNPRRRSGEAVPGQNLDNWGARNEAGSQVLAIASLTSPVSFSAEGMGFEPTTPCGASDFESQNGVVVIPLPFSCLFFPGFCGGVGPRYRGRCTVLATVLAHLAVSFQSNSFVKEASRPSHSPAVCHARL